MVIKLLGKREQKGDKAGKAGKKAVIFREQGTPKSNKEIHLGNRRTNFKARFCWEPRL